MMVASVGALYGATRLLFPAGIAAFVARRQIDKRRREQSRAATTVVPSGDVVMKRPSKRALRAQLAAGEEPRSLVLRRASLGGVELAGADLGAVDLEGTHLRSAVLRDTDLSDSVLRHADLSGADLRRANLAGADLMDCDLSGADLRGADLASARNLTAACLRRARYSPSTRWPDHVDPNALGAIFRGD